MKNSKKIYILSGIGLCVLSLYHWHNQHPVEFSSYMARGPVHRLPSSQDNSEEAEGSFGTKNKNLINIQKKYLKKKIGSLRPRDIKPLLLKKVERLPAEYELEESSVDSGFQKIKGLVAVLKKDFNGEESSVVEERAGFYFVPADSAATLVDFPIVKVKGSKRLGIFMKVLKVKLKDYSQVDSLFSNRPSEVIERYPNLSRAFYKFDSYEETLNAYESISSPLHPAIKSVDIEVIQYQRVGR